MDFGFETEVKLALGWDKTQWESSQQQNTRFQRLINSLRYWSGQLRPAFKKSNVIITLYSPTRNTYITLDKVVCAIKMLDISFKVVGYSTFKNKRYLSLSFENDFIKNQIIENLKFVGLDHVVFLHWALDPPLVALNLFWLSNETDILQIMTYLEQFIQIKSCVRIVSTLKDGSLIVSGKVRAVGKLKDGVNIDSIPHFAYIDCLETLITIAGRDYECFICGSIGHRANTCSKTPKGFSAEVTDVVPSSRAFQNTLLTVVSPVNTLAQRNESVADSLLRRQPLLDNVQKTVSEMSLAQPKLLKDVCEPVEVMNVSQPIAVAKSYGCIPKVVKQSRLSPPVVVSQAFKQYQATCDSEIAALDSVGSSDSEIDPSLVYKNFMDYNEQVNLFSVFTEQTKEWLKADDLVATASKVDHDNDLSPVTFDRETYLKEFRVPDSLLEEFSVKVKKKKRKGKK